MATDVAILGASGYTGAELMRYLRAHAVFNVVHLGAHSNAGSPVSDVAPQLLHDGSFGTNLDFPDTVELVFLALPHGSAAEAAAAIPGGIKVVDLSADHRIGPPDGWSYGLTEFNRATLTDRVANPGCYPTSILLPLLALIEGNQLPEQTVIVDSISGISGAGRKADVDYSFSELEGSVSAYAVGSHRHLPEMLQALAPTVRLVFTPHLAPMSRGMLSTIHVHGDPVGIKECLADRFANEPFVHVVDRQPATKWASGTNHAFIRAAVNGPVVTITSAIDNLGKGAAGQAIQNANVIAGLPETTGLDVFAGVTP